ncbi:hypothetical protein JJJ10_22290 [Klebsiella grimontii]|uniref:hypothetical protein n=2 Tax=Klebsiella grimontii TaxID=2058152 RepID=UPI0015F274D8|nr:hypothetical protein [Klebsiella grimontii]MDM4405826.1 hypothetical protein [Klebsiella grimontii]QTP39143.1 hypothetical protein JJJ10_22290 [Klebsiella grimontii]
MSAEDKTQDSNLKNDLENAIKDKLFNKLFAYVFISFLVVNWQEILILFKSSDDILYTLSVVWTGRYILSMEMFDWAGVFLPAWGYHFGLPFIFGTIASVAMPWATQFIVSLTSRAYARIRHIDYEGDIKEKNRIQNLRIKLAEKTALASNLESKNARLTEQAEAFEKAIANLKHTRVELFYGVKAIVDIYDGLGQKIENPNDFAELLKSVEKSDFYKDQTLSKISRLIDELKIAYANSDPTHFFDSDKKQGYEEKDDKPDSVNLNNK